MALRKIHLYGALRKYGAVLEMDVATPIEAFRALFANFPETKRMVADGAFKIIAGSRTTGKALGEEELEFHGGKPLHIIPVAKGRGGRRGGGKVIIGAVIIAAAIAVTVATGGTAGAVFAGFFTSPAGTLGAIGMSLVLGGVSQILSPTPKAQSYESRESPDQRPSFTYNGAVNTVEQGSALPLVYGQMRTGSVLISAGVSVEQI